MDEGFTQGDIPADVAGLLRSINAPTALNTRPQLPSTGNSFGDPVPLPGANLPAPSFAPRGNTAQPAPNRSASQSSQEAPAPEPTTPAGQSSQSNDQSTAQVLPQTPAFGPSRLSERTIQLQPSVTHLEMVIGSSFKIVSSTDENANFRIRFDESETLTVFVGDTLSGGFVFQSFEIISDVATQIVTQTGYAFQG
ncbi:MAG: hypothetical protein AAFQ04_08650 [Pseudomonadota bacterium]